MGEYNFVRESKGYLDAEYNIKIISMTDDYITFIDYLNKEHTVKFYRDKNRFLYFKYKNGIYYVRIYSINGSISYVPYRRNGYKIISATGAGMELPFNKDVLRFKNFMH